MILLQRLWGMKKDTKNTQGLWFVKNKVKRKSREVCKRKTTFPKVPRGTSPGTGGARTEGSSRRDSALKREEAWFSTCREPSNASTLLSTDFGKRLRDAPTPALAIPGATRLFGPWVGRWGRVAIWDPGRMAGAEGCGPPAASPSPASLTLRWRRRGGAHAPGLPGRGLGRPGPRGLWGLRLRPLVPRAEPGAGAREGGLLRRGARRRRLRLGFQPRQFLPHPEDAPLLRNRLVLPPCAASAFPQVSAPVSARAPVSTRQHVLCPQPLEPTPVRPRPTPRPWASSLSGHRRRLGRQLPGWARSAGPSGAPSSRGGAASPPVSSPLFPSGLCWPQASRSSLPSFHFRGGFHRRL